MLSAAVAVAVWAAVHVLAVVLLRGSGAWVDLFGRRSRVIHGHDPLRSAPRGWIENHEFWTLAGPDTDVHAEDQDEVTAFWGPQRTAL